MQIQCGRSAATGLDPREVIYRILPEPLNRMGYNVSYITNDDVMNKLHKFKHMCGTITKILKSGSKEKSPEVLQGDALTSRTSLWG